MKKFIIDRFEGNYAVCEGENKATSQIPKYKLPLGCKEGDCLVLTADGVYINDTEVTQTRNKRISKKMNRLLQ